MRRVAFRLHGQRFVILRFLEASIRQSPTNTTLWNVSRRYLWRRRLGHLRCRTIRRYSKTTSRVMRHAWVFYICTRKYGVDWNSAASSGDWFSKVSVISDYLRAISLDTAMPRSIWKKIVAVIREPKDLSFLQTAVIVRHFEETQEPKDTLNLTESDLQSFRSVINSMTSKFEDCNAGMQTQRATRLR